MGTHKKGIQEELLLYKDTTYDVIYPGDPIIIPFQVSTL